MSDYDDYRERVLRMLPDVRRRIAQRGEACAVADITAFLFTSSAGCDPMAVPTIAAVALVTLAVEHVGLEVRGG